MPSTPTTIELPPADAPKPVVFFRRNAKGKSSLRKRAATPPPASDSDGGSDYDSSSEGGGDGGPRKIKKRRRNMGTVVAATSDVRGAGAADAGTAKYAATSRDIVQTNDATKQSNWYDEEEAGLLGRRKKPAAAAAATTDDAAGPPADDGTYTGNKGYGSFIKKSADAASRKPVGPVKAPTNIRTITVTDYAPDVCKDYKLTGFCGFGDTCKFLHAREDYAAGWKLDREWEIKQKGGKMPVLQGKKMGTGEWKPADEKEEEEIPFKCVICKGDYKSPIQTKCGHYFCENCAIDRYRRKNPSCAICGKRTDGVFNGAKGLQKKLDIAKERAEEEERKKKEEEEEAAKK
ncbi:hypothetical protein BZA05DRAFT_388474 [Tricharina praecox]|uniref:uncharacterized protein n=1 Tax=Tricharina praecox TaxID=43433 RepID=UPI002220D948|nr:uncharacterized protein BZA05DRAFT_388474 [Tricharina praecox]KAI5856435.1 hypothetical protein BZA05DRAFT_388474 [Tricharina praecox]